MNPLNRVTSGDAPDPEPTACGAGPDALAPQGGGGPNSGNGLHGILVFTKGDKAYL